jgi:hypothetical protein
MHVYRNVGRFYACELGLKLRDKKDPEAAKFMKGLIEKVRKKMEMDERIETV